jgi:WD40 repeat protein
MKNIKYYFGLFALLFFASNLNAQQIAIQPISKLISSLDGIELIAFSTEGELLIAADKKGNIQLWDIDELKSLATVKTSGKTAMVDFLKNGEILVLMEDGKLIYFDKALKELRQTQLKEKIQRASLDPEKSFLSYVNKDNQLKIYSLSANMQQSSFNMSARLKDAEFLGYDRFGQQLVVMAKDGTSILCNPINQQIIREVTLRSDEFSGSASVIQSAASNKGSDLLVTGVQEVFIPKGGLQGPQPERRNSILTYDWDTSQEIKRIRVNYAVDKLVLGPGPAHITYYSDNRSDVTIVDLEQGAEVSQVSLEEYPRIIEISPDDAYLAAGDKKGTIYLFELMRNSPPEIKITKPSIKRGYGDVIIEKENIELEGILSNDSKIKNITINNVAAEILPNGKFNADIGLVPGKNKIRIVAEDYQSNTVYKDVYITRNPEIQRSQENNGTSTRAQKRVALVIGNAEYEQSARLFNTVNDASAMSETLTELGFEVETILNGGYEDMKNAIFSFGSKIRDVDVSLFYYSGHGLEIDGVNYLVPVDAELNSPLDVKLKTIPLTGVLNTIKYTNDDGLNLIILDACRNNPFPTGKRGGAGLAKSTPPSGAIIAYSTAPGSTASDGEGDNGLYTGELVKQLKISQRIEDVFIRTRNNVEEISEGAQQPWEEARLRGIFYLNYE